MSQKKSLRTAAKKIYQEQSLSVSDCFTLEGLKKIGVIFIPSDAPSWVKEIAELVRKQVSLKYNGVTPVIRKTFPLFDRYFYSMDYLEAIYSDISRMLIMGEEAGFSTCGEKLLLCDPRLGAKLLEMHDSEVKQYGENHVPSLLLDVEAFRRCHPKALEFIAQQIDVSYEVLEKYAPYHSKLYCYADYLVVYASGFESWQDLIHAWHSNREICQNAPRVIYVDDLQALTSEVYASEIFHRFSKLLRRMKMKNVQLTVVEGDAPERLLEVIGEKPTIIFIPQFKTYYCDIFRGKFFAEQIVFDICEKSFEECWCPAGPIARQLFCQELSKFIERWMPETYNLCGYNFYSLFKSRPFKDWNMKLYWWNYKIRLGSYCTHVFLSELGNYR